MEKNKRTMKEINFGVLNVRGCREEDKRETICIDACRYNLQILGITETNIAGEEEREKYSVRMEDKNKITKNDYHFFTGGISEQNVYSGVGCVIDEELDPSFKRISDRICTAEIQLKDHKIIIIVAYAPTMIVSEKEPQKRDEFYQTLDKILDKEKKSKNVVILMGDMNAKTGTGYKDYKANMEKEE